MAGAGAADAAMTKAEMVEVADRSWDALGRQDLEALFSCATPDFTIKTDPLWPDGGEFSGREAIERFLGQFLEPWESLRFESTDEPELIGGKLVQPGAWVGRGRATGIDGRIEFTVVSTYVQGLTSRLDFFIKHKDALAFANA
jgi:ketosteroid isomerase-like protein